MGWDVVQIELNPYDLYGIEDNGESLRIRIFKVKRC